MAHKDNRRKGKWKIVLIILLSVSAISLYYIVDPAQSEWMPKCPSKLITGYDCPACGSQRMLHALLHGDISGAWRYNPFIFIAGTYLAMAIWGSISKLPGSGRMRAISHNRWVAWSYVALFFIWWVVRNL